MEERAKSRVVRAATYSECKRKIEADCGQNNYIILAQQTVPATNLLGRLLGREQVEIRFQVQERSAARPAPLFTPAASSAAPPPAREEMAGSFDENKKQILAKLKASGVDIGEIAAQAASSAEDEAASPADDPSPAMQEVLDELRALRKEVATQATPVVIQQSEHESIKKLEDLFEKNDFSLSYTKRMIDKVRCEFSLDALSDFPRVEKAVVEWIGESIPFYDAAEHEGPHVVILVGSTGVGKTTTVAKFAASCFSHASDEKMLKVHLITIDNYRIGADIQLQKLGNIMEIPVSNVATKKDLTRAIASSADADVILIDTIGQSPADYEHIVAMRSLLSGAGRNVDFYLAVAASTKTSDMREAMKQFAMFDYKALIITKFDETVHTGNIISAVTETGVPISHLTDGQQVGKDLGLKKASALPFLYKLEGFAVQDMGLEDRFPLPDDMKLL